MYKFPLFTYSLALVFNHNFILYIDFTHMVASNRATDNATN